jgi:hypothetical protein
MATMVSPSAGGSRKRKQHKIRFYKRGGGPLSPGDFPGASGAPMMPANYTEFPTTIPTSTQIGGGFGFESGGETSTYGGSYAPWSRNCTSGAIVSRGGNDVMSGGGMDEYMSGAMSGAGRRRKMRKVRKTKKGSKKGGAKKGRKTKKGGKKYRQRGCSRKLRGGNVILM